MLIFIILWIKLVNYFRFNILKNLPVDVKNKKKKKEKVKFYLLSLSACASRGSLYNKFCTC